MKKESFEILANLFAVAKSIDNPSEGEGMMKTKDVIDHLTRITLLEMINEKVGKLNVWDFVDTDKTLVLNHLYHKDGFMLASNRRLLLKVKRDYPEHLEGKGVFKDGTIATTTIPSRLGDTLALNELEHRLRGKVVKIDLSKFAEVEKECKAIRKMSRNTIRPIIRLDGGSIHFYYDEMATAITFMRDIGADEISIVPKTGYAARISKDDNVCIIMPVTGDFRQMSNIVEM